MYSNGNMVLISKKKPQNNILSLRLDIHLNAKEKMLEPSVWLCRFNKYQHGFNHNVIFVIISNLGQFNSLKVSVVI